MRLPSRRTERTKGLASAWPGSAACFSPFSPSGEAASNRPLLPLPGVRESWRIPGNTGLRNSETPRSESNPAKAPRGSGSLSTQSHTERRERPTFPLAESSGRGPIGERVDIFVSPSRAFQACEFRQRGLGRSPNQTTDLPRPRSDHGAKRCIRPLPPLCVAPCSIFPRSSGAARSREIQNQSCSRPAGGPTSTRSGLLGLCVDASAPCGRLAPTSGRLCLAVALRLRLGLCARHWRPPPLCLQTPAPVRHVEEDGRNRRCSPPASRLRTGRRGGLEARPYERVRRSLEESNRT